MRIQWAKLDPSLSDCVLVGCDNHAFWMLEWWWNNYIKSNTLPVVFADFGLGMIQRAWCESHGQVIEIPGTFKCNWFKKPLAILACRNPRILWVDVDCEIRGNIAPALEYADAPSGIGGAVDRYMLHAKKHTTNTGVLAVRHGCSTVLEWADKCIILCGAYKGDQEILASMVTDINLMPSEFNWLRLDGIAAGAKSTVMHWTGSIGKNHIRSQMAEITGHPSQPTSSRSKPLARKSQRTCIVSPRTIPKIKQQKNLISLLSLQKNGIRKPLRRVLPG